MAKKEEKKEKKKKKEKWIPVDEIAIDLLKEEIVVNLLTIAKLYERGGKAPKKAIPKLLKHFEAALKDSGGRLHEILEKAIANLKEQLKEKKEE